jgi:mRNA-degrading endonuclease toxin of MazEF toxin-antitoxin module
MALPRPQPGLVLCYSYLWHREHRAGRQEGVKDRPCVVVLAVERPRDGAVTVHVAPVTHRAPDDPAVALELPAAVKRHLGLDAQRSWVVLDELNAFIWPGFDLRRVSSQGDRVDYGLLPPRLFAALVTQLGEIWRAGRGKAAARG